MSSCFTETTVDGRNSAINRMEFYGIRQDLVAPNRKIGSPRGVLGRPWGQKLRKHRLVTGALLLVAVSIACVFRDLGLVQADLKNHQTIWVFPKIGVPQNGW